MILGIGVDILHLPRLNTLLLRRGKEKLAKRILSKTELSEFNQLKGQHDMYLATRYFFIKKKKRSYCLFPPLASN